VAEGHVATAVASEDRLAGTTCLTSHVWRQDHNGFTTKIPASSTTSRTRSPRSCGVYLPPAPTACLVMDHCLRSRTLRERRYRGNTRARSGFRWTPPSSFHRSIGIWQWASNDQDPRPTWSWPAAGRARWRRFRRPMMREHLPELKIRVVNVVDLMRLQPQTEHPQRFERQGFRRSFHQGQAGHLRLPCLSVVDPSADLSRTNHDNIHVRGYKEEGTITTPST